MAKYDILLIGDGTDLLKNIGWVLEYKGFVVKLTANPEAALEALVKKNYDLVIAKLSRENMESLDILTRAKRLNSEVKLIVVSGNNDAIFPLEAYQVDVDDYILMPVSPAELWRRVSYCLESREVMDLQPSGETAAEERSGEVGEPQMVLMFHDIRGAMISTAAALKLMARGTYGEMGAKARAKLQEATTRVEKTIHLTEDFINKSMEGSRPSERGGDCLDLAEDIVEPVLAELADEIQGQQITLVNRLEDQPEGKVSVRGSKMWLRCVFRNLINNGIKFGGRGCTIVVDFENQGSACRLNVYNSGQPVPEARRSMLFSRDRHLQRSKRGRRGLGLGLCLSRDILQKYGGDIWYEPKHDGSNFVMSLPPR